MIASWMAYSALVSALVTLAALSLERVATNRSWPMRIIWMIALGVSVAWPAGTAVRQLLPAAAKPITVMPFTITVSPMQMMPARSGPDLAELIDRGLMAFWLGATALLLFRLARGALLLGRTRHAWRHDEIDGTSVRLSPNVGPAVVGLRSMEVVVPEWILSLDTHLRAIVLRHEEEHRRARDPYLLFGAAVAVALMPWNIALWIQARRLRLAIEMDCDARVLLAHPSPERYGLLMLTIAQRRSVAPTLFAPMLSEPTTQLERRIMAMRNTTQRLARGSVVAATSLAVALIAFACSLQTDNPVAPKPAGPTPVNDKQTYFEFQVEETARALPGTASPRYPDILRSAQVEGKVLAQFVVNPDSTPDMTTFKVLATSHDLFTAAVRNALAQMRFAPAEVGGRPVKQLLQMPFEFSLSHTDGIASAPVVSRGAEVQRSGVARAAGIRVNSTPIVGEGQAAPGIRIPPRQLESVPQDQLTTGVYFEFQVDKAVSARPSNRGPKYPAMLRSANVEGEVLGQFVVDEAGNADTATFKALRSTHTLFTETVREALAAMKFTPAEFHGRPVKQLVQMPFQFSLHKD